MAASNAPYKPKNCDLVLKQVHGSVILQPILQTSIKEACEDGFLLLFDRWQTSPQPCTCC